MIRQSIFHDDPSGCPGDCLRAAVATFFGFELEQVPHFVRYSPPASVDPDADPDQLWWYAYAGFAATLDPPHRLISHEVDPRHGWLPDRPCIVTGKSPRGDFNHVVVYFADGDWWDPHPSDAAIEDVRAVEWFEPFDTPPTPAPNDQGAP